MTVTCPHCQARLRVQAEMAGRRARCPGCQRVLVVPQPSEAESEVPVLRLEEAEAPSEPVAPPPPATSEGRGPRLADCTARAAARDSVARKASAGAFLAALLCFFLPFFDITCAGKQLFRIKGVTLVFGGKAELGEELRDLGKQAERMGGKAPGGPGPTAAEGEEVGRELLAVGAALVGLAGIALCLQKGKRGAVAGFVAAGVAIALLFALHRKLQADVEGDTRARQGPRPAASRPPDPAARQMEEAMGKMMEEQMKDILKVEAAAGFMLAVGLFAAAAALNVVALVQLTRPAATDSS